MTRIIELDDFARQKLADYTDAVDRSRAIFNLSEGEQHQLYGLLGGHVEWPYLPLCNADVEAESKRALSQIMSAWASENKERLSGPKRLRLITMMFKDQYIDFDEPHIGMAKLKRRVRQYLKKLDLHAFVFVEFEPTLMPNCGEGSKRMVCCHIHGFCWSDDPKFKPKKAVEKLDKSRVLQNVFGMTAIQIKAQYVHSRISIEKMAGYVGKFPIGIKKIAPSPTDAPREFNVYANRDGWTGKIALRMLEIYSQFNITDLTIATGDGVALRTEWKRRLRDEIFNHVDELWAPVLLTKEGVDRIWLRVHLTYEDLKPVHVD